MRIRLFGPLTVTAESGRQIAISGAKTQGLVAYLAANIDMPPTRDRLTAMFWGDRFTDQARQSLRQATAKLRRVFADEGDGILISDEDRIGFSPERVNVDLVEFHLRAGEADPVRAAEALELMRGPLLEGVFAQQSEFDDWLAAERQRATTAASALFERVANDQLRSGDMDAARDTAERLIRQDPLRDGSQMLLIRILAQSGERAAAIQRFNAYEQNLRKELGVGAGPELQRLMGEIRSEGFRLEESPAAPPAQAPSAAAAAPAAPAVSAPDFGRPRIGVAPFSTLAPGPEQDFFVGSITENISTNLSKYRWLDVHAGGEMSGPRLTAETLKALKQETGVDFLLHGSLRTLGQNLRLTAQLAETGTGRMLWVQRYDRVCEDIFSVEDELAATIAASVETELQRLAGRLASERDFEELSAWDAYHRGLAIQYEFSANTNLDAQRHFRQAIALDPNFGAAHARLSYAIVISTIYFDAPEVGTLLDEALELARRAAQLDPDDAVARFALGRVYLARGEYERSLTELDAAIALNPGMAQAHCALGDSLAYSGDLDQAMDAFHEAVRISPSDPYRWAFLGYGATALLFKGDYEDALRWAVQAESVPNAHYNASVIRLSALGHLGRKDEAGKLLADLQRDHPHVTCDHMRERLFYLRDKAQIDTYITGLQKAGMR